MTKHGLSTEDRYRLYVKVGAPDECWPWTGGERVKGKGYGGFWDGTFTASGKRRSVLAHRYGWKLHHGEDPGKANVLHSCDNPPCQNPKHWFLGSHQDNMADREKKGRGKMPEPRRVVTPEQVQEALRLHAAGGTSYVKLARKFGVSETTMYRRMQRAR